MDVDRPVEDVGLVVAVDRVEQLVAGEDAAVGLEDRLEQPELDPRQRDRLAVAGDLVAVEVDDQVGVARGGGPGAGVGCRPTRFGGGST